MKIDEVVKALKDILPNDLQSVALHEPLFAGHEWEYVKSCIDTGWVSSVGKYVDRFEEDLARYTGVKRAVAVVNGTLALDICLRVLGVGQGDEVLLPALTFVATANAVSYCGATPHFIDSEESTMGVDAAKLGAYLSKIAEIRDGQCFNRATGRRIKVVIPMHTFGHPVDLDALADVCKEFKLEMLEDAAESLGTFYKGRHTGNWGRVSALSFNGNKIITTGGGGAILTNDEELGRRIKHLTTTAKTPHKWAFHHDQIGFNYRMPNLNAALGCAQLEQLPGFLKKKRALAEKYRARFAGIAGIRFVSEPAFGTSNYWLNTLVLDQNQKGSRDAILEQTNAAGIMTRPAWTPMHMLPMYGAFPRMDLSVAENLEARIVNIPSSAKLGAPYV